MTEIEKRLKNLFDSECKPRKDIQLYYKELLTFANDKESILLSRRKSEFFKALSDEKRIRILELLETREMCVCELMIALGTTQPNLSHHLKILENQGLVIRRKEGKWAFYSLSDSKKIAKFLNNKLEY